MSIWQPQAESRSDGNYFWKTVARCFSCALYCLLGSSSHSNPFLFFHLFYRFLNFGHFSPFAYSIFDGTLPKWSFVPTFFSPLLILSFIFVFIFFCFMFAFLSMSFLVFMFHLDFNYFLDLIFSFGFSLYTFFWFSFGCWPPALIFPSWCQWWVSISFCYIQLGFAIMMDRLPPRWQDIQNEKSMPKEDRFGMRKGEHGQPGKTGIVWNRNVWFSEKKVRKPKQCNWQQHHVQKACFWFIDHLI